MPIGFSENKLCVCVCGWGGGVGSVSQAHKPPFELWNLAISVLALCF